MKQKTDDMTSLPSKPFLLQGWLRALLFCLVYSILLLAVKYLVDMLTRRGMAPESQFGVSVFVSFILSMMAVFCFRRWIDRRSFGSLGFSFEKQGLSGIFLALVILGSGSLILYFSGRLKWTDILPEGQALIIGFGALALAAAYEEVVFRGYILNNLLQSFNKWIAVPISALLFTLFHLNSPGIGLIPLLNIFLAGLLLGISYSYTRNLWFPVLFHLTWNFFQGPVLGFRVSGVGLQTLLQAEIHGDALLTGGDFGFEGSLFATALTAIACMLLYLLLEGKFKSVMRSQPAQDQK
jgi:uncharacterized protein